MKKIIPKPTQINLPPLQEGAWRQRCLFLRLIPRGACFENVPVKLLILFLYRDQVFQRVIMRTGAPGLTVDDLLDGYKSPLLLLWGDLDPWIRPAAADKIQVYMIEPIILYLV